MALNTNEQTLLEVLESMEQDGSIDDVSLELLNKLRKAKDSKNTDEFKDEDYPSVEVAFNNLKYPKEDMSEGARFAYGVGIVTRQLVKLNYDDIMKDFNSILDNKNIKTNAETEEIMNLLQQFYDNIIKGDYTAYTIKEAYEKVCEKIFEKTNKDAVNNFIEKNSELIAGYVNSLPFWYLSTFIEQYAECHHQSYMTGIVEYTCTQDFLFSAEFFELFNQFEYGFVEFSALHLINKVAITKALKTLMYLPTTNWDEPMKVKPSHSSKFFEDMVKNVVIVMTDNDEAN